MKEIEHAVTQALLLMTQTRNYETGQHIFRSQHYIKELLLALAGHPPYNALLAPGRIAALCDAASLHDIGKVGVPDHILLKPGRLTTEEFEKMKTHAVFGRDIIIAAKWEMRAGRSFLRTARDIAHYHHEKWDGSGYPEGLAGEAIPLPARLMAIADVYDALISERPYRKELSHAKAMQIIKEGKGAHFDPELVDAFVGIQEQIALIATRFADLQSTRNCTLWSAGLCRIIRGCSCATQAPRSASRRTDPTIGMKECAV